jgi:hypothetical protein
MREIIGKLNNNSSIYNKKMQGNRKFYLWYDLGYNLGLAIRCTNYMGFQLGGT